jgi:hypothetical protein
MSCVYYTVYYTFYFRMLYGYIISYHVISHHIISYHIILYYMYANVDIGSTRKYVPGTRCVKNVIFRFYCAGPRCFVTCSILMGIELDDGKFLPGKPYI